MRKKLYCGIKRIIRHWKISSINTLPQGNYVDRREAIAACFRNQNNPLALDLLKRSLQDKYAGLRELTMRGLNMKNDTIRHAVEPIVLNLAKNDKNSSVRAMAIQLLANYNNKKYEDLFLASLNDSSYTVDGAALDALADVDSVTAYREANFLDKYAHFRTRKGIGS